MPTGQRTYRDVLFGSPLVSKSRFMLMERFIKCRGGLVLLLDRFVKIMLCLVCNLRWIFEHARRERMLRN